MECVDSSSTYSKPAYAVNSLEGDTGFDCNPIDKDSLQCTFFRQPKRQLSNGLLLSSDTYTDSDSDVDVLDTSRQSSPKLLKESNQSAIGQRRFGSNRCFEKPKVRFGAPVCIDSGSRKRWVKEGNESVPVKLMKRSTCSKKNDRENKKHCEKFKAELVTCRNQDSELTQPSPEKRFRAAREARDGKDIVQDRIIRNKRLLKTVKEVIHTMNETKMFVESGQCIKPSNKVAKMNIAGDRKDKKQRKHPKKIVNDSEGTAMQRPFFENPRLERDLNQSMQKAIKKYRTCWKWNEHDIFINKKPVS